MPPTTTQYKPISPSFETYVQRDLIRLLPSSRGRHDSCGAEVVGGRREVSFNPFLPLRDAFEKFSQCFSEGYPLADLGPWQHPSVFRPYTRIPEKHAGASFAKLVGIRCSHPSLLYITSAQSCSSLVFAQLQDYEGTEFPPHLSQWKRLQGLAAGDIVSLAADTVFVTKALGSLLLTDENGRNIHHEQYIRPGKLCGEEIDAEHAKNLVTRSSNVEQTAGAKIIRTTKKGIASAFVQLGDKQAVQAEYTVEGAYAILATRAPNIHLTSRRGSLTNELQFNNPPSGCIVRGGTKLSISGVGSVLMISKAR